MRRTNFFGKKKLIDLVLAQTIYDMAGRSQASPERERANRVPLQKGFQP